MATLRPDGFAGYEQITKDKNSYITTTEIPYSGEAIRVSADVENGGSLKVTLIDKDGNEVAKSQDISGTITDQALTWNKPIKSNTVRLKFELDNAKVYSFSFK